MSYELDMMHDTILVFGVKLVKSTKVSLLSHVHEFFIMYIVCANSVEPVVRYLIGASTRIEQQVNPKQRYNT